MDTPSLTQIRARGCQQVQSTLHQEDGATTAELFKEPGKTSLYARIFKAHPLARAKLIECREWALKNGKTPAALFMSTYKKFL